MLGLVQKQDQAVRILRRVSSGEFRSPLLLVGEEGTGKRFAVMQTVKEMFCTGTRDTTCDCHNCYQLEQQDHSDLHLLTASGKDIGVKEAREIVDEARLRPSQSVVRVFVIDGADRMTVPAANALLKTLEEPVTTTRFFLLAESYSRVLPTIRSRCSRVDFLPLPDEFIDSVLARFENDSARRVTYTRLGCGSAGRALRYWSANSITMRDKAFALLQTAESQNIPATLAAIEALEKGTLSSVLHFLDFIVRDLVMARHLNEGAHFINQDICVDLMKLAATHDALHWRRVRLELQKTLELSRKTAINLPLHSKAILLNLSGG